jgi:single-strand DNA-binding protein
MNKVFLVGRLGQEPEFRQTGEGRPVCSLRVATSEVWTDKQGKKQENTEWHNIVCWGKLADLCEKYLQKGRQVLIEGKIRTRRWEDKNGVTKHTTEIIASDVRFLDSGSKTEVESENVKDTAALLEKNYVVTTQAEFTTDDIPF